MDHQQSSAVGQPTLLPIREAARLTSYSRDYLTRLAREGKIAAAYLDRQWYVNLDSLRSYAEQAAIEQELRKQQLRRERQREREYHQLQKTLHQATHARLVGMRWRVQVVTSGVLVLGLGVGVLLLQSPLTGIPHPGVQMASLAAGEVPQRDQAIAVRDEGALTGGGPGARPADEAGATYHVRELPVAEEGLLLLPQQATSAAPRAYFSDPVMIEMVDGQAYVQSVGPGAADRVAQPVPMQMVPVTYPTTTTNDHAHVP